MELKEYIVTIEDKNGFQRDVTIISSDATSAVKSLAYGDRFQYNGGVVISVKEK